MILLATLLSFGWPNERTTFVDRVADVAPQAKGLRKMTLATCCGSMRPAIKGGETAFVQDIRAGVDAHLGDIVSDGKVIHRVVALSATGVKLAGDANRRSDAWQPKANLQYIVRVIVRPTISR